MGNEDFKTLAELAANCRNYIPADGIPFFLEMNDKEKPYCKIFSQDLVSHLSEEELIELCPHVSICSVIEKMRDPLRTSHYHKMCDWKPSPDKLSDDGGSAENSRLS